MRGLLRGPLAWAPLWAFLWGLICPPCLARVRLELRNGSVAGEEVVSVGIGCGAYLGLPYASLRHFLDSPRPPEAWKGLRLASRSGPACPQRTGKGRRLPANALTSPDCLSLDVYAPLRRQRQALPILVWLHGGGFEQGSAASLDSGEVCSGLVTRGLVFVAVNFRLGPIGFPGKRNLALADVHQAIGWVRENAGSFGGDGERLMLGGEGSGAALASLVSLSPLSPPLGGLILMSGSGLAPWATGSLRPAEQLAKSSGCGADLNRLSSCLAANRTAAEVISLANPGWAPLIDGRYLPQEPRKILESGSFANLPTMIGINRQDAADLVLEELATADVRLGKAAFLSDLVPPFAAALLNSTARPVLDAIRYQYFSHPTDNLFDHLDNAAKLYTDFLYRSPMLLEALLRSKPLGSQVFVYTFSEPSYVEVGPKLRWEVTPAEAAQAHLLGLASVAHGPRLSYSPSLAQITTRLIAAFLHNSTQPLSPLAFLGWSRFTAEAPALLRLQSRLELRTANLDRQMRFWSDYIPRLMKELEPSPTPPPRILEKIVYVTRPAPSTSSAPYFEEEWSSAGPVLNATIGAIYNFTWDPGLQISDDDWAGGTQIRHSSFVPETRTVLWVMVGLAALFFLLFVSTAAGCGAYHKGIPQYRRRSSSGPNTHSRHQNAQIQVPRTPPRIPQRPPPPLPIFATLGSSQC